LRTHLFLSMNYRMTEMQGAIARAQLQKLPSLMQRRQTMATLLSEKLRRIEALVVPEMDQGTRAAWWIYRFGINRTISNINVEEFYQELKAEGVRLAREYVPEAVFNYVVMKNRNTYGKSGYPFSAVPYVAP